MISAWQCDEQDRHVIRQPSTGYFSEMIWCLPEKGRSQNVIQVPAGVHWQLRDGSKSPMTMTGRVIGEIDKAMRHILSGNVSRGWSGAYLTRGVC